MVSRSPRPTPAVLELVTQPHWEPSCPGGSEDGGVKGARRTEKGGSEGGSEDGPGALRGTRKMDWIGGGVGAQRTDGGVKGAQRMDRRQRGGLRGWTGMGVRRREGS